MGNITIQIGPFNNPAQKVNTVDFVIHYNNNTWNNNNGLDFHIPINNNPIGIQEQPSRDLISVWPVPAGEVLYVGVPVELSTGHRVSLISITGSIVIEQEITAENFTLDISQLSRGFYTLAIGNSEIPAVVVKKILKR
jgi:hypothetical protein